MNSQTTAPKSAAQVLATPLQFLKGVGPQRAELLAKLGLRTIKDAIFYLPRDYQDLTDVRAIPELEEDKLVSVQGTVEEIELRGTGPGRSLLGVLVRQGSHYLRALWFNQAFMRDKFAAGQHVLLSGKAKLNGGRWEMVHPQVQTIDPDSGPAGGKLLPLYRLTEGLSHGHVRHVVRSALETACELLDEVFPEDYLAQHNLWPLRTALPQVHFPESKESLAHARRRLVYQELLVLQLALALRRQQYESQPAPALEATAKVDARIRRLLPFELTAGQQAAITEIAADMGRSMPMNRLLQGDVGSGKTIVAVYAMLLAVAHGQQAALMAPTEVLARQHVRTFERLLQGSHVRIALLTGGLTGRERKETLEAIGAGQVDLVVGTQAIVQAEVRFARLGLVVIDEQHKFGVRQRARLKQSGAAEGSESQAKAVEPHYLVMTATPIPRTVSMTLFGDLAVSSIRDAPPGRQTVHAYLAQPERRGRWWEFVRKKLREGRQAYVIVPTVVASNTEAPNDDDGSDDEETDTSLPTTGLEETFESLTHGDLEAFRLDAVHGGMNSAEKEAAMEAFREGRTQVLLATTVVEVGVDVPNATVMTVLGAQRFGLAQLHQLRGRVSRGTYPGYFCMFADSQTPEAEQRLAAVVDTSDGFQLAELDFQLRGPGDLFGTRQHGLPPLRIANLADDAPLLEESRRDAQQLVVEDPGLRAEKHARLRHMVLARYGRALDLGDVG